jgi:hypothetical protein
LPIGIVIFALGMGNSWISSGKVAEYTQRLAVTGALESPSDLEGFRHLTRRTSDSLTRKLHRGAGHSSMAAGKRDFYALVHNGGRALALCGLALAMFGAWGLYLDRAHVPDRPLHHT